MIRVRNLFTAITLSVLGVFFMLGNVQAATVGIVQGLITEPDSTPIVGVAANLYDSSGNYISYGESNELGYVNFFGIGEGVYELQVRPSESWNCVACGIYDSQDVDFTVSTTSSSYNSVSDIFSLSTIQLAPASRYVTVTVIDDSSNPVQGMYVNGFPNGECDFETTTCYMGGTTDSNGQLQKAIDEDVAGTWNFFADPYDISGYTRGEQQNLTIAATGETEVTIIVQATDSSISGNLVDQNGVAVSVPVDSWGSVNCFDTTSYTNYAFDNLNPGENSYSIDVVGGMIYQCSIWLDGYGAAMNDVTVLANTDVTSNLVLYAKTATANVQPIDADGNVITDVNFSAFGYTVIDMPGDDKTAPLADTQINDYAWAMGSNGTAELSLIDGVEYEVGLFVEQSFEGPGDDPAPKAEMRGIRVTADGTNYIQDYSTEPIVANEASAQTVQFTLQEANAAFDVTVTDSKGNKQTAWVNAFESTNNPNEWGISVGGFAENGTTSLNVLSDKTYELMAFPQGAFDPTAEEKVLPASVRGITPKAGETIEISLQTVIADYALGLDVRIEDTSPAADTEPDFYYCYGYEPENGYNQFTYETPDQIDITSKDTWYVGCMGYAGETFYRSADIEYNPSAQAVDDTLVVELREAGNYYETQSFSFSATSATTLTLQDGLSTIDIPANAIDTSGTVSMVVSTPFQYAVSDSTNPFVVYDIDAFDSNGQQVTSFDTTNIVIKLAYDPESLPEGVDLETILGATYDEDNNSWGAPSVAMEVDTENHFIIITTNQLSMYGGVGDKNLNAVSKPNKPRSLQAKKIKQNQAKLTWKKPKSSTVTKYKVQLRKNKVKKVKQWKQYKNVKKRSKLVKKLDSDTQYQFRVRAKNSSGWSKWAKWKKFTTKPLAE